jgi:hypothetical protein
MQMNEAVARKVLETVDAGLVPGKGTPVPGQMCVEAAVCYALGLPHSDNPPCVGRAVRSLKIRLNDSRWPSDAARTKGMRRLAVAQLGSDTIDQRAFADYVVEHTIRRIVPFAMRNTAARVPAHADALEAAAVRCEKDGNRDAALHACETARAAYAKADARAAAYAAADAAAYAAAVASAVASAYGYAPADAILSASALIAEEALVKLGTPGAQWLWLCDEARIDGGV